VSATRNGIPLIVAHRGSSATQLENTVEAFNAAVEEGADAVELDVRVAADGSLVVHHGARVALTGELVSDSCRASLPPTIPTLDEVLDVCATLRFVNVELKTSPEDRPGAVIRLRDALSELVATRGGRPDLLVTSWDPAALKAVRSVLPGIASGHLVGDPREIELAVPAAARVCSSVLLVRHDLVTEALVTSAAASEIAVYAWVVDRVDDLRAAANLGVAGVVTNDPATAVSTLRPGSGFPTG
jgi:glycerophosphoryl diester phosphodiesterase